MRKDVQAVKGRQMRGVRNEGCGTCGHARRSRTSDGGVAYMGSRPRRYEEVHDKGMTGE